MPSATHPTHEVTVYVSFKYDLGRRLSIVDGLRAELERLQASQHKIGPIAVDRAAMRSWNISYLARHPAILVCRLTEGTATLAVEWCYDRSLRIYPWLGLASIDYRFHTADEDANLLAFYDALNEWKNRDYLPYLKACGERTDHLAAQAADSPADELDLHSSLIRDLREALRRYIDPRPAQYNFHDFRVCFVDSSGDFDGRVEERLPWLVDTDSGFDSAEALTPVHCGSLKISSTGWSTVIRGDKTTSSAEVASTLS